MTTTTEPSARSRIDALLIAGGRSRRFGADKRHALLGTRTLAEIALAKLRAVADGDVFVAGAGALVRPAPVIFVEDAQRGRGPLAGIAGGLLRASFGVIVMPCDAPFVHVDTLATLARLGRRSGRAAVLRGARGWEPLVAFYPKSVLPALLGALREGLLAPHRLLARLGALAVSAPSAAETWNINRAGDFEHALRRLALAAVVARPDVATTEA
ncbi:MAG TPA: molybdenum cofactor guanylyltransferase [Candidatus Limnocylindrales bacterium]|nr:molybdenum cofactor guanylyltransferase [Candidatus Limnocylindrales bacterium]